jgi:hypothetical protein
VNDAFDADCLFDRAFDLVNFVKFHVDSQLVRRKTEISFIDDRAIARLID